MPYKSHGKHNELLGQQREVYKGLESCLQAITDTIATKGRRSDINRSNIRLVWRRMRTEAKLTQAAANRITTHWKLERRVSNLFSGKSKGK